MKAELALPAGVATELPRAQSAAKFAGTHRGKQKVWIGAGLLVGSAVVLGFGWHWISGLEPGSQDRDPARARPAVVDGGRAYSYLKQICDLGPRISGTPANTKQREIVAEHFKKLGGSVHEQPFSIRHPLTGR